ncbi:MAG: multidrug efflux pump, partial [Bacteroidia bacterium]
MDKVKEIIKEFRLSSWSVNNKTSVYVIIFILSIIGYKSYTSMPKESFPEIKQPTIYVNTPYPGNSPIDMENLVTRPIEKEINTINGLKKLTSTSIQDFSVIIAEFELDMPSSEVLQEVKDAVDRAKSELPNDLPIDPSVMELNFSDMPVMNVNVSGNYSQKKLKGYAEFLKDKIENLPEVSSVDITGLTNEEVEIQIDRVKMEALEISLNDVEQAISGENITMSGGDIKSIEGNDITRRNIRIDGEFKDYREIENVIIKSEFQNIVYLRDIGTVRFGQKESTSYARLNKNPVVTLDIKKKSGANLLNGAEGVQEIIEKAREENFPKDLEFVVTNDQSKFTKQMVNNLENSIIMGVLLVIIVLIFFLGLRNSLFVGVAIPLSMLMGIAILDFGGNTLNMMVLFSLILALGMLVDNGIVVVENIYRLRNEGKSPERSSKEGVGEVASAIISSTATTVAAFVPLLFWEDVMGEFMKFLPITLIIVLSSSLFVALVINPVLTTDWMKIGKTKKGPNKRFWIIMAVVLFLGILFFFSPSLKLMGGLFIVGFLFSVLNRYVLTPGGDYFMEHIMPKLENSYANFANYALSGYKPVVFFGGTLLLMVVSIMFFRASNSKIVFFPDNEPKYVNIFVEAPLGTDIEKTDAITKRLEIQVEKALQPYTHLVEAMLAQVGEKTADPNEGPQSGSSPNKARITVSFLEYEKRALLEGPLISTSKIMQDIKDSCSIFPEAQ